MEIKVGSFVSIADSGLANRAIWEVQEINQQQGLVSVCCIYAPKDFSYLKGAKHQCYTTVLQLIPFLSKQYAPALCPPVVMSQKQTIQKIKKMLVSANQ